MSKSETTFVLMKKPRRPKKIESAEPNLGSSGLKRLYKALKDKIREYIGREEFDNLLIVDYLKTDKKNYHLPQKRLG
jgi:hypothetical protein